MRSRPKRGLACPSCGGGKSGVVDGGDSDVGYWRRRKCRDCGHGFVTVESVDRYADTRGKLIESRQRKEQ